MGYTKLFEDIIKSSLWKEDNATRIVWITLLALKDRNHFVRGDLSWIALAGRISEEDCEKALSILESPDPDSHRKENEGRRIVRADGGWFIVNGEYYRRLMSKEELNDYKAEKQRQYRAAKAGLKIDSLPKKGAPLSGEVAAMKALARGDEGEFDRLSEGAAT